MHEIYAHFAAAWLEKKLLPLAIATAGLPAGTELDAIETLGLPGVNSPEIAPFANAEAGWLCPRRPLFCATMLIKRLLGDDASARSIRAIQGLIWRDAVEFAIARDLHMALCNEWFHDGETAARMAAAEIGWERWERTDAAVLESQQEFLGDCAEQKLLEDLDQQDKLKG